MKAFPVILIGNDTQNLARFAYAEGVSLVEVPAGRDSVDFALAMKVSVGDIVVTDDIGLASIVIERGTRVLSMRGYEFKARMIDLQLHLRHERQKIRRSGGRTKGPSVYTNEDRKRFVESLRSIMEGSNKKESGV